MGKFQAGVLTFIISFTSAHILTPTIAFAKEEQSKQKKKECEEAEKKAQTMCNDSAPAAQGAQQQQNQQAQNQGGGAQGNCSNRAQSLAPLLGLLGQLQGGCQAAQADCKQKCEQAKGSPGVDCNDEEMAKKPQCQGTAGQTGQTGSEKGNKCQGLDKNLAEIAKKIAEAMANMAAAKKCEEQTNKDCKDPTFAAANPQQCKPAFNCNVPESFAGDAEKTKQCQCQQNPRGAGCTGFESASTALNDAVTRPKDEETLPPILGAKPGGVSASPLSSPSSLGSASGGSSSGGGKQGGSEKGGIARDGTAGKNDPAIQVNSGEYGGSGGGTKNPGGGFADLKDPARGPAGRKILSRNEMNYLKGTATGANGRSNWQKIRDRYRENHPTFTP